MSNTKKSLLTIISLILATTAALAAMGAVGKNNPSPLHISNTAGDKLVTVSSEVVQNKILKDSDGRVTVSLNLAAARLPALDKGPVQAADLVIVLDRSGSMDGQKLSDACQAVIGLLNQLGPEDRLALVTYSNSVQVQAALMPMNAANRRQMTSTVKQIYAGGGTNLGGGLDRGIDLLMQASMDGRQRKLILISDGLANRISSHPPGCRRRCKYPDPHGTWCASGERRRVSHPPGKGHGRGPSGQSVVRPEQNPIPDLPGAHGHGAGDRPGPGTSAVSASRRVADSGCTTAIDRCLRTGPGSRAGQH